jgi:large subunit ribosomal protein L29
MNAKDLKELTKEELLKKMKDLKEELFNLRFQHSTGQLDNTGRLRLLKLDIARIETVLSARRIQEKG